MAHFWNEIAFAGHDRDAGGSDMGLFGRKREVTALQLAAIYAVAHHVRKILEGRPLSTIGSDPSCLYLLAGCFSGCIAVDFDSNGHDGFRAQSVAINRGFEVLHEVHQGKKIDAWKWSSDLNRHMKYPHRDLNEAMELGIRLSMLKFDGQHDYFEPFDWLQKYLVAEPRARPPAAGDLLFFDIDQNLMVPPGVKDQFADVEMDVLQAEVTAWFQCPDVDEKKRHLLSGENANAIDNLARFWGAYEKAWSRLRQISSNQEERRHLMDVCLSWVFQDQLYSRLIWSAAHRFKTLKNDEFVMGHYKGRNWLEFRRDAIKFGATVEPLMRDEYTPYEIRGYDPVRDVYFD